MEEVLTSQCMEPSKSPLQLLEGPWGFPFDPPPLILLRGKLPHGGPGLLQGQPADTLSSFPVLLGSARMGLNPTQMCLEFVTCFH